MQQFFAIDIGTTNCKAIAVDEKGNITSKSSVPVLSITQEEGQYEQDVEILFQQILQLIKTLLQEQENKPIACISFSAAMHSILAVDEAGKPLTNAIIWADTRSKKYAAQLRSSEEGQSIYKFTGTPIHAMSPLCKLLWLKNEKPDIFTAAAKFISIKEYVFFRLFGKYIIDEGIASATGLYNIYDHCWHQPSLKLAGISAAKLSTVVAATHTETALLPHIIAALKTTAVIPFIPGGNDGCLANLGCGALTNDIAVLTIGTSGAVRLTIPPPMPGEPDGLFRYLLTDKIYVTGGPINNGGIVLQWFADNFLQLPLTEPGNLEKLMQLAGSVNPGAEGLLFLPYLLGERAPVWDENASGMFYNLHLNHTKAHLARAVVEGISFSLMQILAQLEKSSTTVQAVYVSGMVTHTDFWMQLLAHMFGKKIILNDVADASAMGAAFMGMYATSFIKELTEVQQFIAPSKTFLPGKSEHDTYQHQFALYKKLYPASKTINL